ncbi:MAG: lasso peptide isopeptide bond-forming cyclase [Pyrinomonadaceae bacterium]
MSAFAGIFYLDDRPVEPTVIDAMLRPLERRGPDGFQVWTDGATGLGHAQLHTTPESRHEKQPYLIENGRWAIVADLRLDNRVELLAQLGGDPLSSDAEVVLNGYLRWGEACAEHLLGDFAFVIWDREARTIFGARDHLGIKPFYYHRQADRMFVFGSDPAALLAAPGVPKLVNESRIADYLVTVLEGSDKTGTFYRDIFRLPPAHIIAVSPAGSRICPYWSLDPTRELYLASPNEYAEAFLEVFTEAVRCRTRSAGKVGAMLSGGLDSAAVVGVARSLAVRGNAAPLRTYSCLPRDASDGCETPFVNEMLAAGGVDAEIIYDDVVEHWGDLVEEHINTAGDLYDFADIPLICYYAARRDGVQVMLDGVDGDVVAAANAVYLTELLRTRGPREFLRSTNKYAQYYGFSRRQTAGLVWNQGVKAIVRSRWHLSKLARWANRDNGRWDGGPILWDDEMVRDSLIDHDFADRIGLAEKMMTVVGDTQWGERNFRENDAVTLNAPIITAALERYDRAAASQSIEARHPFFDKRVVEFCLALPLEQKQSGGWAKSIVRRATEGLIPDSIRWRRYSMTNLNQRFFVKLMGPHRAQMAEKVETGLKEISGYVNHAIVSEFLTDGSAAATQPEPLWKLYQALRLLTWLRRT